VHLRISFADDVGDQADLESLFSWLLSEPALSGKVAMDHATPLPGEMGVLANALIVSVSSGGTLSILALSLKAWLSQPRRVNIRIRIRGDDVAIEADHIGRDQAESIIRQVLNSKTTGEEDVTS
jgi:hypothetical protein